MKKDIEYLKEQKVDFIISSVHFGQEYQTKANEEQKDLVQYLFENGVDIVLGSHPHVLQQAKMKSITNSGGTTKNHFVIYSMGNFIATQNDANTNTGVIVQLELKKNTKTGNSISNYTLIPTYIDKYTEGGKTKRRIIPLKEALDRIASGSGSITKTSSRTLQKELDNANKILNAE